jgi:hypothetical protein
MEQIHYSKANNSSAGQKISEFHRTSRIITMFATFRHLSLSWAKLVQSTPSHSISLRQILIFSFHLRLGLSSRLFLSGLPTKTLHAIHSLFDAKRNSWHNVVKWHKNDGLSYQKNSSNTYYSGTLITLINVWEWCQRSDLCPSSDNSMDN